MIGLRKALKDGIVKEIVNSEIADIPSLLSPLKLGVEVIQVWSNVSFGRPITEVVGEDQKDQRASVQWCSMRCPPFLPKHAVATKIGRRDQSERRIVH